jgi:hypothetical protein
MSRSALTTRPVLSSNPAPNRAPPALWNSDRATASANLDLVAALDRLQLWPLRVLWVVLALLASTTLAAALDGREPAVVATAAVLVGTAWTATLVALLVPRALSLTVVRLVVPTATAITWWSVLVAPDGIDALGVAAGLVAGLTLLVALSPTVSDQLVDGSSYGPERRIPLRTPVPIVALAVVTWALTATGALLGPLLLADGRLGPGIVALVVGGIIAVLGARSMHQLSRRWLVLVPTGMVLHDPLTMPEPQLFLRQTMARLGPAAAVIAGDGPGPGPTVEDLTAGASGLVLELELEEPVELLVYEARRTTTLRTVDAVRFTATRPAALLAEARGRRLPVD